MVIKNLTKETQKLQVESFIVGAAPYDVYLMPNGTTDLEGCILVNQGELSGKIEILGDHQEMIHNEPKKEEIHQEEVEIQTETKKDEPKKEETANSDAFICEICGAEFASARGLASHMNRAHAAN